MNQHIFRHKLQRGIVNRSRDDALCTLASGKRVLHIGCVDWPVSAERLASGDLLHQKLIGVAASVVGVDIDEPGMETLREALGGKYVYADLADSDANISALESFAPDLIIAGDVVEHVTSAQQFLTGIAKLAKRTNAHVIVTTPNSLAFRSTLNTAMGLELMHPDHVAVHSPLTLRRCLETSGLSVVDWRYYGIRTGQSPAHRLYDAVSRTASLLRSGFADGHLVVCTAEESPPCGV